MKKRLNRTKLEQQIVSQSTDSRDTNISDYITSFVEECRTLGPLEKISLLTPEEASEALVTLAATQAKIERQLKTAQALKRLLSEQ